MKRSNPRDSSEHNDHVFYLEIPYTASFDPLDGFNDTILEDEKPSEPYGLSDDQVSLLAQDSLEDANNAPNNSEDESKSAPSDQAQ